jgi:hypothetical protein
MVDLPISRVFLFANVLQIKPQPLQLTHRYGSQSQIMMICPQGADHSFGFWKPALLDSAPTSPSVEACCY